MSDHKCNLDRCHRCPLLGGEVMPGCMGTTAGASDPYDMTRCTCPVLAEKDKCLACHGTGIAEAEAG